MGTDDFFNKRKGRKIKRKENMRQMAPYRYLIVCEGEKTEPYYFIGIKKQIDKKFVDKVDIKIELDIEGTGKNTESLVNYAIKQRSLSEKLYGNVWVVFDKDNFSDEQFENAIKQAEDNEIKTAWSNESIELWFLLHFEYLDSALSRYQYFEKLNNHFKGNNINNGKYSKNMPDIYQILNQIGNVYKAIDRSKKLLKFHKEQGITRDCLKNPCTKVYELVEQLLELLDQ